MSSAAVHPTHAPVAPVSALRIHAGMLGTAMLFASLPIGVKLALVDLAPRAVVGLRTVAVAVILVVVAGLLGKLRVPSFAALRGVALCALFGVALNQLLFIEGLALTTATNAAILITTIPLATALIALVLRQEKGHRRRFVGLMLGFVGALVAVRVEEFSVAGEQVLGNVMILVNAMAYGMYLVLSRRIVGGFSTIGFSAWLFVCGATMLQPLTFEAELAALRSNASEESLMALTFVVFATACAYMLGAWSLKRASASALAAYTYAQPVFTGLAAVLLLGETLNARMLLSAALIAPGVYLAGKRAPRALDDAVVST